MDLKDNKDHTIQLKGEIQIKENHLTSLHKEKLNQTEKRDTEKKDNKDHKLKNERYETVLAKFTDNSKGNRNASDFKLSPILLEEGTWADVSAK